MWKLLMHVSPNMIAQWATARLPSISSAVVRILHTSMDLWISPEVARVHVMIIVLGHVIMLLIVLHLILRCIMVNASVFADSVHNVGAKWRLKARVH